MSLPSGQTSSESPPAHSSYHRNTSSSTAEKLPASTAELNTRSSIMTEASKTSTVSAKYILIDNIELTLMKHYPTNLGN